MEPKFPFISKELIEELNKRFPLWNPKIGMTEQEVFHRAGQRAVVEFLNAQFKIQEGLEE